ncbi:uncharacterized protein BO80DRAFT_421639 [Aspergillus ibericus CBS 121593]|uniref:SWIM-type domain-containing protein n=1 Tax=Aspergillus ibericus CBS 121593 TaxID=1448316 RepID=A0A395HBD2_9EURO|nr:hypothetical protein BO80DRAFT_421639 [Aspergillus ibericus CBS 121593]RAL05000.1 hypothetical protein BO80DRAFT_421639 [Aspergillus ibericus CBS 121593]
MAHPHQCPSHPQSQPSTPQFINHLISRLAAYNATPVDNNHDLEHRSLARHQPRPTAFSTLPASQTTEVKAIMLTLHCLFPNELLLALDILDRGLMNRFVRNDNTTTTTTTSPTQTKDTDTFHVLSAATLTHSPDHVRSTSNPQSLSHMDANLPPKGYEVRLHAWNCTCPTFTLSAFRDLGPEVSPADTAGDYDDEGEAGDVSFPNLHKISSDSDPTDYSFGGTLTRGSFKSSPPVCKHLLACLLAVRCPGLVGLGEEGVVGVSVGEGELAGWGAGWGG